MDSSNYEIIQAMYDELKKEQSNRLTAFHEKKSQADGIEIYLEGLLNKEDESIKVFLPRKTEDAYRDVIEKSKLERDKLLAECEELEKQLYLDENRIKRLEKILTDLSVLHVKRLSILDVHEKERQRIARDLHDTSLQNLTHLVHEIEMNSLYIDEDPVKVKSELASIKEGIRNVIEEIRNSIFDLRPILVDSTELKEIIMKSIDMLNRGGHFLIETDIDEITVTQSDPTTYALYITMYRLIRECVQNAVRHSGGNKIIVKLKDHGNTYRIYVQDDGTGFDVKAVLKKDKYFGLSIIKEKVMLLGGMLNIDVRHGTSIDIEIPKV